ncbi:MAG: glyoxalase [Lachnospiraceae bacterium]|nr:glyoxalase [Lachnospiraceae bacterium]
MFDKKVTQCFIDNQFKLFPKPVATTHEEAAEFLEECFAQVLNGKQEVIDYFEEEGIDYDKKTVLDADEVFDIGDGRYLVIEA